MVDTGSYEGIMNTEMTKIDDYNSLRTRSGSSVVFAVIDDVVALRRLSLRSARLDGYQDAEREAEREAGGEKDWFIAESDCGFDFDSGPAGIEFN